MKSVSDHLERGIQEFEEAYEKAPMGTRMMISDLLDEANELSDRVANIAESDNDADD